MSPRPPARRLVGLLLVFILSLAGIAARLAVLQVKDAGAYQALARDQRVRTIPLPAPRGSIFDRDGHPLAMSLPAHAVYADPTLVDHPRVEARALAEVLDRRPRDLRHLLRTEGRFVYLARGLDDRAMARVADLHLAGIGFLEESRRYYPAGVLAPQVVGFVGVDGTGLAGIELEYQHALAGRAGSMIREQDPSGRGIPQAGETQVPPVPGDDVVLTIDKDLQYEAQRALVAAVRRNQAIGGTILVMQPGTGDILAMASYPWFDPNKFAEADPAAVRARAITDVYEPGSVNKVITASAAVEERLFPLRQSFPISDTHLVGNHLFHDAHEHPTEQMTLPDIIAYSSNIGTIETAQRLGQPKLARYLSRFGFGKTTGIGFPGEASGIMPARDAWWSTSMATIPIGQGIAVTPLQMASVYATIANGGIWVQPRLVRGTMETGGRLDAAPASASHRVVSERTADRVTEMLAYAVEVGTGTEAQIPGYWVAGKTGTARKPLVDARGYGDHYVASFIGFLPAEHPSLVIAAILDEPVTVYGGIASAPLFKEVAQYALAHFRIPTAPKPPTPPHAIPVR